MTESVQKTEKNHGNGKELKKCINFAPSKVHFKIGLVVQLG